MQTPGTSSAGGYGHAPSMTDSRIYMPSISSEEMLDENAQSQKNHFRGGPQAARLNRKLLVGGLLLVVAVVGAVVAVVVTKGDSSTPASNASGTSADSTGSKSSGGTNAETKNPTSGSSTKTTTAPSENAKVRPDPTTGTYPLAAFAIGDWGQTIAANDSCCQRRQGKFNGYDRHAETGVAKLMDMEAERVKPSVVISHGDNFYWTGIEGNSGDNGKNYRFENTFESRHTDQSKPMYSVPWVNVLGNHDYGGGSYICINDAKNGPDKKVACKDGADLLANLKKRFEGQSTYHSPHDERWILKDHFYTHIVTKGDVSMEIFNLDMNDATSHAMQDICCQCYGYADGDSKKCKDVQIGSKLCANGDSAMFKMCIDQFKAWGAEARTKLVEAVKKSTATWKVVNSHYLPYGHFDEPNGGGLWMETLKDLGVQVWLAGHTHGEKHDYAPFGMHFIENGAGGGIQSEGASGVDWASKLGVEQKWSAPGYGDGGDAYGFFSLEGSADWMRIRFMTFDDKWKLSTEEVEGDDFTKSTQGGVKAGYCYYIPSDGSEGRKCDDQ